MQYNYKKGQIRAFKLIKEVDGLKLGKKYDHFSGLVSGVSYKDSNSKEVSLDFWNKEYFKPVIARKDIPHKY